jgi:hypothetical protein
MAPSPVPTTVCSTVDKAEDCAAKHFSIPSPRKLGGHTPATGPTGQGAAAQSQSHG